MNNSTLPYWLTLLVALAASYGGYKWYQVEQARPSGGVELANLPPLQQFELTERSGETFRSAEMRGKVWAVSFFFTTCPGSCKRLNTNIKYLHSRPTLADVTFVSISVDPQTDSVPVLAEYAKSMNADPQQWLFVRGEMSYVRRVGRDVLQVDDVSYQGHRDFLVLVDRAGTIRGAYDAGRYSELERIEKKLVELLAEAPPKADEATTDAE
ncbi:MAG: SCO family protein [Pirellulales bacterium]|nr:SCO family protein [Pirellulales bacterium]